MKDQLNQPLANVRPGAARQKYQSPVLSYFGLVTELTKSIISDCRNDGIACGAPPNNMGQKAD